MVYLLFVVFVMLIVFNKFFNVFCQFIDCSVLSWLILVGFGLLSWVYVVGWFDYDSEGLLLLIDNGMLVYKLIDFRYKVDKIYWVQVEGMFGDEQLQWLCDGVELNDGLILLVKIECFDLVLVLWLCDFLV